MEKNARKIKKQMDFFFNESLNKWKKIIEEPSFQEVFIYNNLSFWPRFKEGDTIIINTETISYVARVQ